MRCAAFCLAFFLFLCPHSLHSPLSPLAPQLEQSSLLFAAAQLYANPSFAESAWKPLPTYGQCQAGREYTITSSSQLYDMIHELPCLWSVGLVPDRVPLGGVRGKLVALLNTARYDPIVNAVYQGDFVVETQCDGRVFYMGFLQVGGRTVSTGEWYIGHLPVPVSPKEYMDERGGLILNFSESLKDVCAPHESVTPLALTMLPRRAAWNSNIWPIRTFVDSVRVVGKSPEGKLILLGRTFQKDDSDPFRPASTAWYFQLETDDPSVLPSYITGTPLPSTSSFEFYHQGIKGFTYTLIPKQA